MESVQWDDHSTDLFGSLGKLYQNVELIDCVFETHEGLLKAHKAVLAACSPLLKKIFMGHQGMKTITLKKIKYRDLKYILDFIYFGEVDVPLVEMASFMKTAQVLQIAPLKRFLSPNFSVKFSCGNSRQSNNRIVSPVNFKKNSEQSFSAQGTRGTYERSLSNENSDSHRPHIVSVAKTKKADVLKQGPQREKHTQLEVNIRNTSVIEENIVGEDHGSVQEHLNACTFVTIPPVVEEVDEQSNLCSDSNLENSLEVRSNGLDIVTGRNLEERIDVDTESSIKIEIAEMDVCDDLRMAENVYFTESLESGTSATENVLSEYERSDPQTNKNKTVNTALSSGRIVKAGGLRVLLEPVFGMSQHSLKAKAPVTIDLINESGEEQSEYGENESFTSEQQSVFVSHEPEGSSDIDHHLKDSSVVAYKNRMKGKDTKGVKGNISSEAVKGPDNADSDETTGSDSYGEEVQIQNCSQDQEILSCQEGLTVITSQEVVWDVLDASDQCVTSITDVVADAAEDKKVDVMSWVETNTEHPDLVHTLRSGNFSDKDRRVLVQIVVSAMCKEWGNMYPPTHFKEEVAKAIVQEFPALASKLPGRSHESFFDAKTGDGYLEYRLKSIRIRLPSSEKRRRGCRPGNYAKHAKIARQEPRTMGLLTGESLTEKVVKMKNIEASETNKTVIRRLMAETRSNRMDEVRITKKLAADGVLHKYPHLKSFEGEMIDEDFKFLYPEHANKLLDTFSSYFAPRILKIAEVKSSLLLQSLGDIEYNLKALIILPDLLPQPKAGRKQAKKFRNILQGMREERGYRYIEPLVPHPCLLRFIPDNEDLTEASEPDANQKQPFLVCVTTDGSKCGPFFIRFNSVLLPVGSNAVAAFDRLFKLHFLLGVEYAQPLLNFYNFIESCIYRGLGTPKCCTDILHTQIINVQLQSHLEKSLGERFE